MDSKLPVTSVEIVTHCYRYSRLLCYHLSSLLLSPPTVPTQVTVFTSPCDEYTLRAVDYFHTLGLSVRAWPLERAELFRRSIGRNMAARATEADLVWFADCDYWFGEGCLDSLTICTEEHLYTPQRVVIHKQHELGDKCIHRLTLGCPRLVDISPEDFMSRRVRRAIGGIQIVTGDTARKHGYLETWRKGRYMKPSNDSGFQRCAMDSQYRKMLVQQGIATKHISIPNTFRLRHSAVGRVTPGVYL
jgi:hypothetical protein